MCKNITASKFTPLLTAPLVLVVVACATTPRLSCTAWNSSTFFKKASVRDVKHCLSEGANINAKAGYFGKTPLHWAAEASEAPGVVKALLDAGANVNVRDRASLTPLHWAAEASETPGVVKVLVDAGADLEAKINEFGATPLHQAAAHSETPGVVKALLAAGANIDPRNEGGWTPLHAAASYSDSPDVVKALLAAGANPKPLTFRDSTPADLIQQNDDLKGTDAYWLLLDRGGQSLPFPHFREAHSC